MSAWRPVNTQVAVVGPLSARGVADIKQPTGVPKGEPLRLFDYWVIGSLNFYHCRRPGKD